MANGQFFITSNRTEDMPRNHFVRMQSSCWNIRTEYGSRSHFWTNGGDSSQSALSVDSSFILFSVLLQSWFRLDSVRAHPTWSMFAACVPEKPCITPGTYAFLGAAAGLAWVAAVILSRYDVEFCVYLQWYHSDNGDCRCDHVWAHRGSNVHPANYGEPLKLFSHVARLLTHSLCYRLSWW